MTVTVTGDMLIDALQNRLGRVVDVMWAAEARDEALAYIRLLAPCQKGSWLTLEDLPADVQTVLIAALARMALNPNNIRQETVGEYSVTYGSGTGAGPNGPFSPGEVAIIRSEGGCGGSIKTIQVTSPAPLPLDQPELGDVGVADPDNVKPTSGWTYEEPSHSNGFVGRWVAP